MTNTAARLHEALAAVCPIRGVRITGEAQGEFLAAPEATAQQIADAEATLAAFDWSAEAQAAWELDQKPTRKAVIEAAAGASADIDAYLAIPSPTAAQVRAAVDGLARIVKKLIQYAVTLE